MKFDNSDKSAVKRAARAAWWERNLVWVLSPVILGAVWVLFTFYRAVQVYARNQGSPWGNFDANSDKRFSRPEVEDIYGMSGEKFTFCDEDGDDFLSPREYSDYCSRAWVSDEKAPRTPKAARALRLLRQPSETSASLVAAYCNEDGKIYREATPMFWEVPEFSAFKLDQNGDGVITEPELRGALGLPPPEKKGLLSGLFAD